MSKRVYAGNLNFEMTDSLLRQTFARIGGVENAEVVRDRWTGVSRGFGFIEMMTGEDAEAAVAVTIRSYAEGTAMASRGNNPPPAAYSLRMQALAETLGKYLADSSSIVKTLIRQDAAQISRSSLAVGVRISHPFGVTSTVSSMRMPPQPSM